MNVTHEITEQDKQNALKQAMNVANPMPDWLRLQLLGKYGSKEDIQRFAESLSN